MHIEEFVKDIREPELLDSLRWLAYYVSEKNQWIDCVDSVSPDQILLCWRMVEKLKVSEIPDAMTL